MKLQKLLSYMRRAVDDYEMIEENDKIAIGISGGKDSLTLLTGMAGLQRFYPKKFEIVPIAVSLGFGSDYSEVSAYCESIGHPLHIVDTQIGEIIFNERKETNPCSLCAKMRKGALNDAASALGCNKIALGHNKDDIVETFYMSLFFEARIYTFAPVTFLDRKELYSIRPLMYVKEGEAWSFAAKNNIPVLKNLCPADGNTKREEIKQLIKDLSGTYDNLLGKTFSAIQRSGIRGWTPKRPLK